MYRLSCVTPLGKTFSASWYSAFDFLWRTSSSSAMVARRVCAMWAFLSLCGRHAVRCCETHRTRQVIRVFGILPCRPGGYVRQLLFGLAGLGAGALFYATRIEPRWLEIRDLTLRLPCWPRRLDGLTVLHLSDLHAKPGEQWQHDLIRQAAAVEADLVCLTGDYGDRPRWAPIAIDAVRGARGRLGTFAVLGNHDFDARVRDGERPARFSPSVAARVGYHMEAQGITV